MRLLSRKLSLLMSSALILGTISSTAPAATNNSDILFILDGSGSMWAKIDGVSKIATAKNAMTELLDSVPANARIGLMTYGTTSKSNCDDVKILNQIGASRSDIKNSIAAINPLGKTPIEKSLLAGINNLASSQPSDTPKSLVLVSDGIETCNGDPCAVAANAARSGVDMKVHVVGFDVEGETRAQLECIAKNGGGTYFDASDTIGFKEAMNQVVQIAQASPEPAPVEPKSPAREEFFRDDFDGDSLGEIWSVEGETADNYLAENGKLLMISTKKGGYAGFAAQEPQNLISFQGELPKGNWDAEITFTGEFGTGADRITFGLRKDRESFLTSSVLRDIARSCRGTILTMSKVAKGDKDSILQMFRGTQNSVYCDKNIKLTLPSEEHDDVIPLYSKHPLTLTFSKRGRSYSSTLKMEGFVDEKNEQYVIESEKYTSLRSPGNLTFSVDRFGKKDGEVLFEIDSIVIYKVNQ